MLKKIWFVYFLLFLAYAWFSFSLTDPNLVITSLPMYWNWQQWMWRTFFDQAPTLSWTYGILITAIVGVYVWLATSVKRVTLIGLLCLTAPLLFSYNALSHDVFNYMFNAKMVVQYRANPHVQVATDFPQDDWVRFMHNIHTPAPYGYGWTGISLIPLFWGMGKFITTWLSFRLMSVVSFILLYLVILRVAKAHQATIAPTQLALVFLNPLLLIEIISNSHNDLWMMVPAVASIGLIAQPLKTLPQWSKTVLLTLILLGLSVSIKLASLALVPLWLLLVISHMAIHHRLKAVSQVAHLIQHYAPLLASVLMFIPLLTTRSQQFHPWYLTWVLVWLPFFHDGKIEWLNKIQKTWTFWVIALSISSLYRYLPWLLAGNFDGNVIPHEKIITWGLAALLTLIIGLVATTTRSQSQNTLQ